MESLDSGIILKDQSNDFPSASASNTAMAVNASPFLLLNLYASVEFRLRKLDVFPLITKEPEVAFPEVQSIVIGAARLLVKNA